MSEKATVWFAPVRSEKKQSLVTRAGLLLERAGCLGGRGRRPGRGEAALRRGGQHRVRAARLPARGRAAHARCGRQAVPHRRNTLYRGKRFNAVDHLACAIHNGFSYATVDAPIIIADGLDGREGVDVRLEGFDHFDTVRIGAAAVHADAMVVVTHVKGHEATGFGGAIKNVGMGLGCRSAKQRMHADFKPEVRAEKCTACGRCVQWCPVEAITIGPDRVAVVDYEICYGCGECVAACPYGAIAISGRPTRPDPGEDRRARRRRRGRQGGQGRLPVVRHERLTRLRLLELLRRADRGRHRRAGLDRHRRDRPGRLRPGDRSRGPAGLSRRGDGRRRGQVRRDHGHRRNGRACVRRGARPRVRAPTSSRWSSSGARTGLGRGEGTMDYGAIIRRAWQITWRHKALWVLGLFAGISGCQGGGSSGGGGSGGRSDWSTLSGGGSRMASDFLETFMRFLPVIIAGTLLLVALGIIWSIVAIAARGGLIAGVNEVEEGRSPGSASCGASASAGSGRSWVWGCCSTSRSCGRAPDGRVMLRAAHGSAGRRPRAGH